ncbi:hypothetical protein EDD37DRAFT_614134 [Exophiala viscosa]|uniref:uncharacterized protein n=1 Tax=Exophiala viscosa TaxID=2486360 RepID=UPI002194BC43|nr:hypothetical protein EDD37DRAFT_614134 [Exophiala viscosa]
MHLDFGWLKAPKLDMPICCCAVRAKAAFIYDYRSSNTPKNIEEAASALFPRTPTRNYKVVEAGPSFQRPSCTRVKRTSSVLVASWIFVRIRDGSKIWTLHATIESLNRHSEVPSGDGHMIRDKSWHNQWIEDVNFEDVEPEIDIEGQCGLYIAAAFKVLGVSALIVERNHRRSLSPPLLPEPLAKLTPAGKMGDWLECNASAFEGTAWTWTDSSVVAALAKCSTGDWDLTVQHGTKEGQHTRTFRPKPVVLATSLVYELPRL